MSEPFKLFQRYFPLDRMHALLVREHEKHLVPLSVAYIRTCVQDELAETAPFKHVSLWAVRDSLWELESDNRAKEVLVDGTHWRFIPIYPKGYRALELD